MSAYTRTQRQSKRCLGVRVPSIHRRVCHFHRHPASHQLQEQGKKKRKNESGSESIPEFFFLLPYIHLLFKNIYMPIKATGESELEARKKKYPNHIHTHTHTHTHLYYVFPFFSIQEIGPDPAVAGIFPDSSINLLKAHHRHGKSRKSSSVFMVATLVVLCAKCFPHTNRTVSGPLPPMIMSSPPLLHTHGRENTTTAAAAATTAKDQGCLRWNVLTSFISLCLCRFGRVPYP